MRTRSSPCDRVGVLRWFYLEMMVEAPGSAFRAAPLVSKAGLLAWPTPNFDIITYTPCTTSLEPRFTARIPCLISLRFLRHVRHFLRTKMPRSSNSPDGGGLAARTGCIGSVARFWQVGFLPLSAKWSYINEFYRKPTLRTILALSC